MDRPSPHDWERVKSILASALDLVPDERDGYLDEACDGRGDLREEVTSLLAAHARIPDEVSLTHPFAGGASHAADERLAASMLGTTVGAYRLVDVLGQGGMGVVYLAARADGVHEGEAAVKLLRRGFQPEDLARFRAEQRILARLEHPGIARLLDAGVTDDGQPYLIMEYVAGSPITEHCDAGRLEVDARLGYFAEICDTLRYAHRNLVVHRDLKPSNIMVDREGRVKLLDFGIAKLLDEDAYPGAPLTRTGLRVLTPEYASPEQLRGEPVTTSSDVYGLGLLLYELLAGRRPFRLDGLSAAEVERVVCGTDPVRPSQAIDAAAALARGATPEKLRRKLTGDLDVIVLTALRKKPERRFASVRELAEDLRRHRNGQTVTARPATVRYRLSRFARRHRMPLAALMLVVFSLVAGIVATTRQALETRRRLDEVRSLANTLLFDLHDAVEDIPGTTPVRRLMVSNALFHLDALAGDLGRDPDLKGELAEAFERIGRIQGDPQFANLGDLQGSLASYARARELRDEILAAAPDDRDARRARAHIVSRQAVIDSWNGDNDLAIARSGEALAELEELLVGNAGDAGLRAEIARVRDERGWWRMWAGELEDGIADSRAAVAEARDLLVVSPDDLDLRLQHWTCLYHLAEGLKFRGDPPGALFALREGETLLRDLEGAHPANPRVLSGLQVCLRLIGENLEEIDLRQALDAYREALASARALYAVDANNTNTQRSLAACHNAIGGLLLVMNRWPEAITAFEEALPVRRDLWIQDPGNLNHGKSLAITHQRLCETLVQLGEYRAAQEHGHAAIRIHEQVLARTRNDAMQEANVASVCGVTGRAYLAEARAAEVSSTEVQAAWQQALELISRTVTILERLSREGRLPSYWDQELAGALLEKDEARRMVDRPGG